MRADGRFVHRHALSRGSQRASRRGSALAKKILVGADRGLEVADFHRIEVETGSSRGFARQPDQPGILAPIVDDGDPLGSGERAQAGEEQQRVGRRDYGRRSNAVYRESRSRPRPH